VYSADVDFQLCSRGAAWGRCRLIFESPQDGQISEVVHLFKKQANKHREMIGWYIGSQNRKCRASSRNPYNGNNNSLTYSPFIALQLRQIDYKRYYTFDALTVLTTIKECVTILSAMKLEVYR
jgi:hypothetical protein